MEALFFVEEILSLLLQFVELIVGFLELERTGYFDPRVSFAVGEFVHIQESFLFEF